MWCPRPAYQVVSQSYPASGSLALNSPTMVPTGWFSEIPRSPVGKDGSGLRFTVSMAKSSGSINRGAEEDYVNFVGESTRGFFSGNNIDFVSRLLLRHFRSAEPKHWSRPIAQLPDRLPQRYLVDFRYTLRQHRFCHWKPSNCHFSRNAQGASVDQEFATGSY